MMMGVVPISVPIVATAPVSAVAPRTVSIAIIMSPISTPSIAIARRMMSIYMLTFLHYLHL